MCILDALYYHLPIYREISWQEFQNNILPSGTIERIDIVNKSFAR